MQSEDDLRGLAKVIQFLRATSLIFLLLNVYWFCYEWFLIRGLNTSVTDKILLNFQHTSALFSYSVITKLCCLVFLALSCYGTKGVQHEKVSWQRIVLAAAVGFLLFFFNDPLRSLPASLDFRVFCYAATLLGGYLCLLAAGIWSKRLLKKKLADDPFNTENESFEQESRYLYNEYSVNLPTEYLFRGQWRRGFVNIINPFRASMTLGNPGSGKSASFINSFIRQHIAKGFSMYIYDYKYDDLTLIAYNNLLRNRDKYKTPPRFCVINFDDPHKSNRCNPLDPRFMTDISDAYESSFVILMNLNKTWTTKSGDFFVESAVVFLATIIWFLKIYNGGRYCTFPHAIEFMCQPYEKLFPILAAYPELENYISPYIDAWKGGAQDQLQGQIASARIPLSRIISPQLYWVMTGNDFTLDINNPEEPKVLCIGNNPDRQNIYSAALGLYNSRIVRLINRKGKLPSSIIIDELPTIYFRGLDNLIATARSNRVSVCLGFQDFSQLERDYGEKEAKVIINTVGNVFAGQVVGDTARILSERFGKNVQLRKSHSISNDNVTSSTNTQLDSLIPASKISTLTQGMFVGAVADNIDQPIEQKIFHARIVIDHAAVKAETDAYVPIPEITSFIGPDGKDQMDEVIAENYYRIKKDATRIIELETKRIAGDPKLAHLLQQKK